ncbi:MAG: Mu-like prophage protein gpG [Sedimentibacter sp.]|nr:Mu-like prophage protein gpG [Sedimentibacter sp.]
MAQVYVKYTGQWEEFRIIIKNMTPRIRSALKAAARKNAILILKEIRNGIREQAPGGEAFPPLHTLTVIEKSQIRGVGSVKSNQALIRYGDLLRLLTYFIDEGNPGSFKVGYPEGATNRYGIDINMIAAAMEKGFTVNVTEKLRGYFAANGRPLKKETTHLDIPARPYFEPVLKKYRDDIVMNYVIALDNVFKANPNLGSIVDGDESGGWI